jgi:PAS domain S-box-containing protein
MMRAATPQSGDHAQSAPNPEQIARAWARAIAGTSYVSMSRQELQAYLADLASRLLTAVTAEAFEPQAAYEVGAALVKAHFTQPASLDRTVCVLTEHLGGVGDRVRRQALQGALAAGYAQALRERTLAEQEEIRAAAMLARSEAESARWASEARFQAVFAGAVIGIAIADIQGRIVDVNQTISDMLGYKPEELRRLRLDEFIHPEDAPGIRDAYREMLRGNREPHPRPRGRPQVRGGDGRGHHRAARPADPAAPPGPARPADPVAQPHAVLRAAGRGPRRRRGGRAGRCLLPRRRRLQDDQ